MGVPSLLIVAVVLVVVLAALARRQSRPVSVDTSAAVVAPPPVDADALLRRAVDAGVVTAEQAAAVLALGRAGGAAPTLRPPARVPPVLEVLGYLGAVLIMVGAGSLVARFWDDLAGWSRLTILGAAAAVLTGTGLALRDEAEPVLWRLRSVVLAVGSAAVGGFAGLLVVDTLDIKDQPAVILVAGAVALHSGLLWWRRDRPAQQAVCGFGLVAVAASSVSWAGGEGGAIGLSLWAMGGLWLLAAWRGLAPPQAVAGALGAVLTLVSAAVVAGEWRHFGVLFGLATAAALVAAGIRAEEFLLTAIGVLGSFGFLPATVNVYFGGTIGVPAVMVVSGAALLALTAWLVQHRTPPHAHPA